MKNNTVTEKSKNNLSEQYKGYDFLLFSDGSGHYSDGIGGYCAIVVHVVSGKRQVVMGAMNNTSVPRQEFEALLAGLYAVYHMEMAFQGAKIKWFSDCEALVKCVAGEYERKSSPDMWNRFAWYERQYQIEPNYLSRDNDMEDHNLCDLHASTMREILKDYIQGFE